MPVIPPRRSSSVGSSIIFFSVILVAVWLAGPPAAHADCPPGVNVPITSGDPAAGPPVFLTGLGAAPTGSFFVLGAGDTANSGTLPASASPGPYVLEITATDDNTPELVDRMLFDWKGERWMSFRRKLSASSP